MNDWIVFGTLAALGIFLLACGVMVHCRKWLQLLYMNQLFPGQPALAITWLGLALSLLGLAGLLGTDNLPGPALGFLGLILFPAMLAGIIGMFWYPVFLRPRWLRRDAELQAKGEDLFAKRFLQRQGQPPQDGGKL